MRLFYLSQTSGRVHKPDCEEERDDGSGEEEKTEQQLREKCGVQQVRWQIMRRKGQDELIYGQAHPYPPDEQKPTTPNPTHCGNLFPEL